MRAIGLASNAFEDSVDQLLKVLAEPTVPAVVHLIQGLERDRTQAALYHDELHDEPSLSAYTLGIAETYGICAE